MTFGQKGGVLRSKSNTETDHRNYEKFFKKQGKGKSWGKSFQRLGEKEKELPRIQEKYDLDGWSAPHRKKVSILGQTCLHIFKGESRNRGSVPEGSYKRGNGPRL